MIPTTSPGETSKPTSLRAQNVPAPVATRALPHLAQEGRRRTDQALAQRAVATEATAPLTEAIRLAQALDPNRGRHYHSKKRFSCSGREAAFARSDDVGETVFDLAEVQATEEEGKVHGRRGDPSRPQGIGPPRVDAGKAASRPVMGLRARSTWSHPAEPAFGCMSTAGVANIPNWAKNGIT